MKQDAYATYAKQNKAHSLLLLVVIVIITFLKNNNNHDDRTIITGLTKNVNAFAISTTYTRSKKNDKIIATRNLRLLFNSKQQQQYSTTYSIRTNPIYYNRHKHHDHRLMTTSLYCICINCSRVTECTAYHFVETKHEQPHMKLNPTFTPSDGSPTIHVNIRTTRSSTDVINRIRDEHDYETKHAEEAAADSSSTSIINQNNNSNNNEAVVGNDDSYNNVLSLRGNTIYDVTPITTYEYDVVKCVDYVEDIGCWIRNMPEEIRLANPNFVPT